MLPAYLNGKIGKPLKCSEKVMESCRATTTTIRYLICIFKYYQVIDLKYIGENRQPKN